MKNLLKTLKALSDGNRLKIVSALMQHDELCVCQIMELLEVTGATTSRHLSLLVSANILNNRKEGRWIFYSLNKADTAMLEWLETNIKKAGGFTDIRRIKTITTCNTAKQ